jgi:hypothetical protein
MAQSTRRGVPRLAGAGGAFAAALLLLLAVAGGGAIDWMMFGPFLIAVFLVIAGLVYFLAWLAAALTCVPGSVSRASEGQPVMRWPRDFPGTQWLLRRCYIVADIAIALGISLAWAGLGAPKAWNTFEIAFVAIAGTAIAIVGTLWVEAVQGLARNWQRSSTKQVRERRRIAR